MRFLVKVRSAILRLLLLSTCLSLFPPALAGAAIQFVHPSEKAWVGRSDYLILKLNNPQFTDVKVVVNGVESDKLPIGTPEYRKSFRDFLILQALWDKGKNVVRVEGYNGPKIVETAVTEVYFQEKQEATAAPEDFRSVSFHSPENEKLCSPCHNMNPTTAQADETLGKGNPCFVCHNRMINVSFVHGPAGTFSCTFCHAGKETRYAVTRRDAALCGECHVDQVADIKKRKFRHGPVDAGMCEICHDPHGTPYPAQLRAPINELCLSCHEKVGKGVHVVQTAIGGSHPVSGVPDPSRPGSGRMLSCVSCHNPHAGDVRFYFPNNAQSRMALCSMCHNK